MRSGGSTFRRFTFFLTLILTQAAFAGSCPNDVTPQQIANALQNSPNLSPSLKSCSMAAMLMKEFWRWKHLRPKQLLRWDWTVKR